MHRLLLNCNTWNMTSHVISSRQVLFLTSFLLLVLNVATGEDNTTHVTSPIHVTQSSLENVTTIGHSSTAQVVIGTTGSARTTTANFVAVDPSRNVTSASGVKQLDDINRVTLSTSDVVSSADSATAVKTQVPAVMMSSANSTVNSTPFQSGVTGYSSTLPMSTGTSVVTRISDVTAPSPVSDNAVNRTPSQSRAEVDNSTGSSSFGVTNYETQSSVVTAPFPNFVTSANKTGLPSGGTGYSLTSSLSSNDSGSATITPILMSSVMPQGIVTSTKNITLADVVRGVPNGTMTSTVSSDVTPLPISSSVMVNGTIPGNVFNSNSTFVSPVMAISDIMTIPPTSTGTITNSSALNQEFDVLPTSHVTNNSTDFMTSAIYSSTTTAPMDSTWSPVSSNVPTELATRNDSVWPHSSEIFSTTPSPVNVSQVAVSNTNQSSASSVPTTTVLNTTYHYDANSTTVSPVSNSLSTGNYITSSDPSFDVCSSLPCLNNATCQPLSANNSYYCNCMDGFTGLQCGVNINDCLAHNCSTGQVCVDGIGTYSCQCLAGFGGVRCDSNINECSSNPCLNGGTCVDRINGYTCVCPQLFVNQTATASSLQQVYQVGYIGSHCEQRIDACALQPSICMNGGICMPNDEPNLFGFTCFCPSARHYFTGRYCQLQKTFCDIVSGPNAGPICANGGTCQSMNNGNEYVCNCAPGFTGANCTININECESNPCPYYGTCIDLINGYKCSCAVNSTATSIDCDCLSNPCQHGGQCLDGSMRYYCNCTGTGYTGVNCSQEINECESMPCQHGARCYDLHKNYTCQCFDGYAGQNCEVDIDECLSSPCLHNSTCVQRSLDLNDSHNDSHSYVNASGFDCRCSLGYTGVQCENNINECLSTPCQNNATCVDGIGVYTCQCADGFRGRLCEIEIDECVELVPCANNATCIDLVADYSCSCQSSLLSTGQVLYGGRNCTVALVGCAMNVCANGGTCRPVLVDEQTNNQSFTCDCPSGYYGKQCDISTSVSLLNSDAWIQFNNSVANPAGARVGFQFRTTVSDGVLVSLRLLESSNDSYVVVTLSGGSQVLITYLSNTFTTRIVLMTPLHAALNDAQWYGIVVQITGSNVISVLLFHPDCPGGCQSATLNLNGSPGLVSFGKRMSVWPGFVGCMRDLTVDSIWLTPVWLAENDNSSSNVTGGCQRTEQCSTTSCSSNGRCVDNWSKFICLCRRPYVGPLCSESLLAATFGKDGIATSYAEFVVPQQLRSELENHADVSFFVRTLQPFGTVLYLGSAQTFAVENHTSLLVQLVIGGLKLTFRSGSQTQSYVLQLPLADGNQHFVQVIRSYANLSIALDDSAVSYNVTVPLRLAAEVLFVGGAPALNLPTRRERDTATDGSFSGTLQDLRINGALAEFFPQNISVRAGLMVLSPVVLSNVSAGEQSNDVCSALTPCQNNGTCRNVFYNDYSCLCTQNFKGRNCNETSYCFYNPCPQDSVCYALDNGYECAAQATFNGSSSSIKYSFVPVTHASASIISITFRLRSRSVNGTVITLQQQPSGLLLVVDLLNGAVSLSNSSNGTPSLAMSVSVSDGQWHSIVINVSPVLISLSVDGSSRDFPSDFSATLISQLFNGTLNVLAGDVGTSSDRPSVNTSFKGCLDDIRINGHLLPFANNLTNVTDSDRFVIDSANNVNIGCRGDGVCSKSRCENDGICIDLWNAFTCRCPSGFNGTSCEHNINDCVTGNECLNGGTCVDGVASFQCQCTPGFTGIRCDVDINECFSRPCRHNGSCVDQVNSFSCQCAANYTGARCEIDLNANCAADPCLNNATCFNVPTVYPNVTSFNCSCLPGFAGDYCEQIIDPCLNNSCQFMSTCIPNHVNLTYTCACAPGYSGRLCETEVNECASRPCLNGKCVDLVGNFSCTCSPGWTGEICDTNIDECINTTLCENNATCIDTPGSYKCNCSGTGYEGVRCELAGSCLRASCLNSVGCLQNGTSYTCLCATGFSGKDCSCGRANCSMHGQCNVMSNTDGRESFKCLCDPNRTGTLCEEELVVMADTSLSAATIGLIVGIIVGSSLIVLIIAITVGAVAKKKRATHGSYSPSRQEMAGSRVDFGSTFKVPPEERLI